MKTYRKIQSASLFQTSRKVLRKPASKRVFVACLALLSFVLVIFFVNLLHARDVKAAWLDDSFKYRQSILITNPGSTLADFQVSFTLDTATLISAGKMQSNCNDIRVADVGGTVYPHVIEEGSFPCNTSTTKIWTRLPSIPNTGLKLFVYYGNTSAINVENGSAVFDFYDSFDNNSLNAATWTATGATSFSGGALSVTTGAVYSNSTVLPDSRSYIYEMRSKPVGTDSSNSGLSIADAQSYQTGNAGSNALISEYAIGTGGSAYQLFNDAADGTSASYNLVHAAAMGSQTVNVFNINGFSLDNNEIRFWLNNAQTGSTVTGSFSAKPFLWMGFTFGSAAGTTNIMDLTIDWVRARKYVLNPPTVGAPSAEEQATEPIGYWKLDEGQGATAFDTTSTHDNAAFTSTPTWQPENMCVSGKCLYFDGTTEYLTTANTSNFDPTKSWTAEAWVKGNTFSLDTNVRSVLFQKDGTGTGRSLLGVENTTSRAESNVGGSFVLGPTILSTNTWYHIASVYNASTGQLTVYTNGLAGQPSSITPEAATGAFTIGINKNVTNGRWNGFIDDVKVYNYARSPVQLKLDYASRGTLSGTSASLGGSADSLNGALSNGLVGYWKFDESSTQNATDSSGNATTLTDTASATHPVGKFGNSAGVNGTTQYFTVADNATLSGGGATQSMAISAWVNLSSKAAFRPIVGKYVSSGNQREYVLDYDNASDRFSMSASGDGTSTALTAVTANSFGSPSTGTWYFVLGWYDATNGTLNIQVNDLPPDSVSYTGGMFDSNSAFTVGSYNSAGSFFAGSIDDVRVYKRVLNATDRSSLYTWGPGPLAYYKMDENLGTGTTFDSSGNGYAAALAGATKPTWVPGMYGSGLNFDGATSTVNIDNTALNHVCDGTNNFTLSSWFKFNGAAAAGGNSILFLANSSQNNTLCALDTTGGRVRMEYRNDAGTEFNSGASFFSLKRYDDGGWHYGTVVKDGTSFRIYVDGILTNTLTDATAGTFTSTTQTIGALRRLAGTATLFNGSLDEAKIYSYARTDRQIIQDMNGGHPLGGSPVSSMLGYWNLDEGQGQYVHDKAPSNNILTEGSSSTIASDDPTWVLPGSGCVSNGCQSFNGSQRDQIADNVSLSQTGSITLSAWVKRGATGASEYTIVSKYDDQAGANQRSYRLFFYQDHLSMSISSDGTSNVNKYSTYRTQNLYTSTTQWYHVVGVYSAGQPIKLYVNGARQAVDRFEGTGTEPTGIFDGTAAFEIGHRNGVFYTGSIDEVKVYGTALTDSEVLIDYNQGSAVNFGTGASIESTQLLDGPGNTPYLQWSLDEGTGTLANDTSGNSFAGTLTNSPAWVPGKLGDALQFNGSSNYVTTSTLSINPHSPFTLSLWLNLTRATPSDVIGELSASTTCTVNPQLWISTGAGGSVLGDVILGKCGVGAGPDVGSAISMMNKWTHLEFAFDGTNTRAYRNGVLTDTYAFAWPSFTVNRITMGASRDFTVFSGSIIDDVKLYNYARTPAQVEYDYNRGKPLAYYNFDQCQGTSVGNSSAEVGAPTATLSATLSIGGSGSQTTAGTCTTSGSWFNGAVGKVNSALSLDGTDDFAYIWDSDAIDYSASQDFTVATWVKIPTSQVDTSGTNNEILAKWSGSGGYSYAIRFNNSTHGTPNKISVSRYDGTNNPAINSSMTLNDNQWHHIAFTKVGSVLSLYIDGRKDGTTTDTTSGTTTSTSNLFIGERGNGTLRFTGMVDELKIFNYGLSTSQILQVMNNGAVTFGPATGSP